MTYVSSGEFRADLERLLGRPLARQNDDDDDDDDGDALERFPEPLRTELRSLRALQAWSPPMLCVLRWGDFCSVPALYDEERDVVLEDWFRGDAAATDFVMSAVDIVNGGGGFYFVVDTDGRMGLVCEDPHSFDLLPCTMPEFLRALVAAHQAACTQGLDAATAELRKVVEARTAKLMLTFAARLTPQGD